MRKEGAAEREGVSAEELEAMLGGARSVYVCLVSQSLQLPPRDGRRSGC